MPDNNDRLGAYLLAKAEALRRSAIKQREPMRTKLEQLAVEFENKAQELLNVIEENGLIERAGEALGDG